MGSWFGIGEVVRQLREANTELRRIRDNTAEIGGDTSFIRDRLMGDDDEESPVLLIALVHKWRIRGGITYVPPIPEFYTGSVLLINNWNDEENKAMAFNLLDDEKGTLALQVKTAAGNDAQIDGGITYELVNPTDAAKVDLFPSPDTRSVNIVTKERVEGGEPTTGLVALKASADADLGEGVQTIEQIFNIDILPASAGAFSANLVGVEKVR